MWKVLFTPVGLLMAGRLSIKGGDAPDALPSSTKGQTEYPALQVSNIRFHGIEVHCCVECPIENSFLLRNKRAWRFTQTTTKQSWLTNLDLSGLARNLFQDS